MDGRAPLPMLELDCSQTVADPFVEFAKDAWRIGQPEILLPANEISPQLRDHRLEAPTSVPARDAPDALLHRCKGLTRDAPLDLSFPGYPKAFSCRRRASPVQCASTTPGTPPPHCP